MPRSYEDTLSADQLPYVDLPDWTLLRQIETLFRGRAGEEAVVTYRVADAHGTYFAHTLEELRNDFEQQELPPTQMSCAVQDGLESGRAFFVWVRNKAPTGNAASFESPDQADVDHLVARLPEVFAQASSRRELRLETEAQARRASNPPIVHVQPFQGDRVKHGLLYDPWVVGIGTAVVAAAIIALLVALFH